MPEPNADKLLAFMLWVIERRLRFVLLLSGVLIAIVVMAGDTSWAPTLIVGAVVASSILLYVIVRLLSRSFGGHGERKT